MRVVFTKHARNKFRFLKDLGWSLKPKDIREYFTGSVERQIGYSDREVTLKSISKTHDLRIVYVEKGDIITVITFYPARKGRYDKK